MHKSAPKLLYQINASVSRDHTPSPSFSSSPSTHTYRATPTSFHCIAECISTHLTRRDKKQAAKNCQPDKSSIETENVRDCAMCWQEKPLQGRGGRECGRQWSVVWGVAVVLTSLQRISSSQTMNVCCCLSQCCIATATQLWLINVARHFGPQCCDNNLLLRAIWPLFVDLLEEQEVNV